MTTLITPLPTPPTRQNSSNFNDRADEFLGALPLFQQEANALAVDVQSSADDVEIARQAVVSTANVTKWISGTTYAQGAAVWSPINGVVYRKMTSTTGGTTDPSLDSVNYKSITDASGVIYTPAGTGAVTTTVQSKLRESVSVKDFGADPTGAISSVQGIRNAIASTRILYFPEGDFLLDDEITIDKSITINCAPANEYGVGGTRFIVSHNDATKSGFKVGYSNKNIRFELNGEPKFDAPDTTYNAYAGIRCTAATVYIDGIRSTANINGLFVEDSYIGYVNRLQGSGKNYVCKVAGDSSLTFKEVNLGGTTGGLASFQIVTVGGQTRIDRIYLEAQSNRNLIIDGASRSSIYIGHIYAENSAHYDISINNSENVVIENYRTNTNAKAVVISGSSNVKINNVQAVDRFSKNAIVTIDSSSDSIFIGGVLYDPVSSDGVRIREYSLVRGGLSGAPALPMVVNPDLMLSANGTTSTVGGSAVTSNVPTDTRMSFSSKSIQVTSASPLKIPFTKWRKKTPVVVQCIYKCTAADPNSVAISFYKSGTLNLLNLNSFHESAADFQMLTFVTRLPDTDTLDQYSSLQFHCDVGVTAEVHYLNVSQYDGGMLPFGFVDESILLDASPVTLNTINSRAVLAPRIGGKTYRFKAYELVYDTGTGATGSSATVAFGDANSSGTLGAAYCNFTTAINQGAGLPCSSLSATGAYPFRDHYLNTTNGWVVEVTSAATHGGTAKAKIRAVPIATNAI
jgi:hypothetical protein